MQDIEGRTSSLEQAKVEQQPTTRAVKRSAAFFPKSRRPRRSRKLLRKQMSLSSQHCPTMVPFNANGTGHTSNSLFPAIQFMKTLLCHKSPLVANSINSLPFGNPLTTQSAFLEVQEGTLPSSSPAYTFRCSIVAYLNFFERNLLIKESLDAPTKAKYTNASDDFSQYTTRYAT